MFPETKSRETLRFDGKQNYKLFPEGQTLIKCFVLFHDNININVFKININVFEIKRTY
jgi:hypothetical protein